MAFPTTSVLDDFNRSNVGPPLGGNWSVVYNLTGFTIVSNHIEPGGSALTCGEYWNAATFGPDCEAYITDLTVDTTGAWAGIVLQVRLANPGSSTMTGYEVDFYLRDDSSTVGDVYFYRLDDSATFVQLGATITGLTFSNGVTFGIEMIGSTLKAYYKPSGGSWTEIGSRTDTTYDSAGYIAVGWWYTDPTATDLDDFGGGTVVGGTNVQVDCLPGIALLRGNAASLAAATASIAGQMRGLFGFGEIASVVATGGVTLTQDGFRWRNDDGDEDEATWAADQDANHTVDTLTPVRLRVLVDSSGDTDPAAYRLEYRKVGDPDWEVVQ